MEYKKSQSLSEQVADEILDMIVVKKQFKIGDKLPNETELSALLNVSRTTLREAIKMLVLQDIVEIKRGKGTFVKSDEVDNFTLGNLKPNTSDLADLLEMRLIIEPMGAYYATKRASDNEIEKIIEYGEIIERKILNNEDRTDAEQQFHNAIAKASGRLIYEGISADYKQGDKRKCNFIKTIRKSDRTYIKRSPNDNRFYERKKCRRGENCDEFTHYTYNR